MNDEKVVEVLNSLGYEPFKDEALPNSLNGIFKYCVYYEDSLVNQDQKFYRKIIEFVFVNEVEGTFDEDLIIPSLEKIGLSFVDGSYGRLKKVNGGDLVNSLTLRFSRPRARKLCVY